MQLSPILRKATELGIGFTAIATLILAGCGGGGGSSGGGNSSVSSVTTTITPFKGMFTSGTVSLKDVNGNLVTPVSGGSINPNGTALVTYPANVAYPLTVEVTGTFLDETSGVGATGTISADAPLRGLIPAVADAQAASGVPVTVLTEFARTMLPSSGFSAASAVAAITDAASGVIGVASYSQAMLPPVFNAQGQTSDQVTLKLAALAHVINQQGSGANLSAKLQNIATQLAAGSAVNAVIPQTAFNNALGVVNGGASSLLPVGVTGAVPIPAFVLPGTSLRNLIAAATPTCPTGQVLLSPQMQCVATGVPVAWIPPMSVTGLIPSSGAAGTRITITGSGFSLSSKTSNYKVIFTGNVQAPVLSFGGTLGGGFMEVTVPTGAVTGVITIINLLTSEQVTTPILDVPVVPIVAGLQPSCISHSNVSTPLPASGVIGTDWSDCSRTGTSGIQKVVWGDTQFVSLLSSGGQVSASSNGYEWTMPASTLGTFKKFGGIAFNGSRWVGASTNSLTPEIYYSSGNSPTGWTLVNLAFNPGTLTNVFSANGRFFIGTVKGSFLSSTDGITWTDSASKLCNTDSGDRYAGNIDQVFWDGSKYLMHVTNWAPALAPRTPLVCTSADGLTWTSIAMTFTPATRQIAISPTQYLTIPSAFAPFKAAWNGSKFVTWAGATGVWSSANGADWIREADSPSNISVSDLIWAGTQFIAVGYLSDLVTGSAIATSPDGISWTKRTALVPTGQTLTLNSIAYSPTLNKAVAVGQFTTNGMIGNTATFVTP